MEIDTSSAEEKKTPKKKEAARRFAQGFSDRALPRNLVGRHVLSYLLRNCYRETAIAFLSADVPSESDPPILSSHQLLQLDARRAMMDSILQGDILPSIQLADKMLGCSLADAFPMVHLRLLCQHFVELVRKRSTFEALSFAQQTIAPLGKRDPKRLSLLQTYLPLLAYREPEASPVFNLFDVSRREHLAEELNGCVFGYLRDGGCETRSELECLLRQLTMVMRRIRQGDTDWRLDRVVEDGTTK